MTDKEFDCKFQALITRREAFIAGNRQREITGFSPSYPDAAFFCIETELLDLVKELPCDK